ncbi:MAG: hypothetical protein RMM53_02025, partial [Bacteroidia bacterium]|nr:hypothetical protein [Bacteroidia bacterium]
LYGLWCEIKAALSGRETVVSRESVRAADMRFSYNGELFTRHFDFRYTPVVEAVERTAKLFKAAAQKR